MKKNEVNIKNQFESLKRVPPFRTPENYFENFSEHLLTRIGEEEKQKKNSSLFVILKPALAIAAVLVLALMLSYEPVKEYILSKKVNVIRPATNTVGDNSIVAVPGALISAFSEEQFLSAFSDMDQIDSNILTSEKLEDYIATNYSDYEILTNN